MSPYRLNEFRAKIQFIAPANFPMLINAAARKIDTPSQTRYIQLALCEAIARDLDMEVEDLIDSLPPTRGVAACLFGTDRRALTNRAPRIGG